MKFVMYVFPWGEEGPLKDQTGPDKWQRELLIKIGEEVKKREADPSLQSAIQIAVVSGHGVGKTALVSWLLLWSISTRPNPQILTTANTMNQLSTKTWRELAKWHQLSIHKDWFEWTATKFYLKEKPNTWFASAIPWSENRPEAFAGMHEEYVFLFYDEASGIADNIWEVSEGAMTTPKAMWFAFGNGTRNTGRFRECFGRFKHRWVTYKVDSRDAKMANLQQIEQWIDDYGEDSDFVRVRVKGEFPKSASTQFIGHDIVDACVKYEASHFQNMPYILGVDVARFGDDQSVIVVRQGRKLHIIRKFRGLDGFQLANRIYETAKEFVPFTIFIDGLGLGSSPVDFCRNVLHLKVNSIEQQAPKNSLIYANKRAEMWGEMRDWLKEGADIPNDSELIQDLTSVEYGYNMKGQILLEKKESLKSRGLASPDVADALALTFAAPVAHPGMQTNIGKPIASRQNWSLY